MITCSTFVKLSGYFNLLGNQIGVSNCNVNTTVSIKIIVIQEWISHVHYGKC